MLRVLLIIILGYLAYQLFKRSTASRVTRGPQNSNQGAVQAPTELVMDPTCKTYLPRDKAIAHGGHYFCSLECRDKYQHVE